MAPPESEFKIPPKGRRGEDVFTKPKQKTQHSTINYIQVMIRKFIYIQGGANLPVNSPIIYAISKFISDLEKFSLLCITS